MYVRFWKTCRLYLGLLRGQRPNAKSLGYQSLAESKTVMPKASLTDITFLGNTPYERLKALMQRLRQECPWDSQQTFQTIAPYTIEEAYEVSDAINRSDMKGLKEELGDLLFQVLFHAQMASEEQGGYNLDDVSDNLVRKMVVRHPHVFPNSMQNSQSIYAKGPQKSWESIKAEERKAKGQVGLLDDVALALPALMRAEKLQKRAASVGFDWPDLTGVFDKISEETQEVTDAIKSQDQDAIEDEIGDLLFAVTNLARKTGVDSEKALRRTNTKFSNRFRYIETKAKDNGRAMEEMNLDEMETLWQKAKFE